MTSSCIRLVWQPIQHKDRQRAESGETDSWVAANRQGGPPMSDATLRSVIPWLPAAIPKDESSLSARS